MKIILLYKVEQYKIQDKLETKNKATLQKRIQDLEVLLSKASSNETTVLNYKKELNLKQNEYETEKTILINENKRLISKFVTFENKILEVIFFIIEIRKIFFFLNLNKA